MIMISVICGAVLTSVVSAMYQPRPLPFQYGPTHPKAFGGADSHGHGGGIDPLTLLLLQKNGGSGNAYVVGNIVI